MRRFALVFTILVVLNGCGGGGGGSQISPNSVVTIQIPANQAVQQQVEDATIVVDAGTFPVATELVVEQWNANQYAVPNQHGVESSSGIVLEPSSEPTLDLTVRFPKPAQAGDSIAVAKTETGWEVLDSEVVGQTINVTVPKESLSRGRGPGTLMGLIAIAFFPSAPPPDQETELVKVAGSGAFATGRSALIVHGFADSYDDFAALASKLMQTGRYTNVYSFSYDWRLDGVAAATRLRDELQPYRNSGKVVDVYAHSWGGLVTRYALEVLGETYAVDNCYFVCSPHLGTPLADLGSLIAFFVGLYLNAPGDEPQYRGLLSFNTASLNDLRSTGAFVNELKDTQGQRGHVNYYLIGGGLDLVVPFSNATAVGQQLEENTSGVVVRHVDWSAGHTELVKKSGDIGRLISFINGQPGANAVEVLLLPNPVEAGPDGWLWDVQIRNYSSQTVTLKTLTFDSFNKNGEWLGVVWYDPNSPPGVFFPPEFREWDVVLPAGWEAYLSIGDVPDRNQYSGLKIWEVPIEMRARSLEHTLVYERANNQATTVTMLTEYYQNLWPSPPHTRAPRGLNTGNGVGQRKNLIIRKFR